MSRARLLILASALLFSTGGAVVKSISLSGWQVACLRSGIAALVLFLALPAARRRWSWGSVGVGVAYAATMILFVLANKLTTAANTIFLQSTAPLYILLLSPWLLKEKVHRRDVFYMLALAVGMGLFFVGAEARQATAPDPWTGNLLSTAAGVTWALTVVGMRSLGRGRSGRGENLAGLAAFQGNLFAGLFCIPFAGDLLAVSAGDWAMVGYLGAFQIGLAYVLLTSGLRDVPALEASLLLLVEPVLSPLWAWSLHGEVPASGSLVGGLVIVAATAVKTVLDARRGRRERAAGRGAVA
ncbi:MAG: EamA family transporter [Acidobacteriota bacterium]